jgi:class 3 adenylate cyclase/TolB-like protein/Tfp pilus assembly protein PilF
VEEPASDAKRELAAIMFSDVVGYTTIMGRDEQKGLEAIARHRAHLRTALPKFHGRLIGEIGDGSLSSFQSVVEAVACARALQTELRSDPELRLRIGIHLGDVVHSGDTLLGDGINVASRIHALAAPGGICVSASVYDEIRNKPGMRAKDLGEKKLKNVSRPIRVYALSPGSDTPPASSQDGGLRRSAIVAGIGAIVVAVLGYGVVRWRSSLSGSETDSAGSRRVIRSIAVLPLDNFSGDPRQDYFADGMTDELTSDLATLSRLRVISRGSAMRFKGEHRPSTPEIARVLNVDAVVEGSVVRAGDKIRIIAQLIDAPADRHLWGKSFEGDARDVLALQSELASAIAREIDVRLTPAEQARLSSARAVNPEAHDAYLKGRYFSYRPSDENLQKAISSFEEAIRLDPGFARAYSGLADSYSWIGFNEGVMTNEEAMARTKAMAEKALALDDGLAEAHNSLGQFAFFYEYDRAGSEREFRRALALNPSYAYAHDQFGVTLALQGRLEEGLSECKRAVELDPLAPEILNDLSMGYAMRGDFEEARVQARRVEEIDPSLFLAQAALGWIDIEAGQFTDAIPALQKAVAMDAPSWVKGWLGYAYGASGDQARAGQILSELRSGPSHGDGPHAVLAVVYIGMGDRERGLDELERAYTARSQLLTFLGMDRMFDSMRSEPRFVALAKKVGFDK